MGRPRRRRPVHGGRRDAPVHVINDADAAGLAEMRYGAGRGRGGVVLMLTFGTGIGSGLFLDGRLVPNTELGHLEIDGKDAESRAAASARGTRATCRGEKWADRVEHYLRQVVFSIISPDLIIVGGGASLQGRQVGPADRRGASRSCPPRSPTRPGSWAPRSSPTRSSAAGFGATHSGRDCVEGRGTHVAGGVPLRENGSGAGTIPLSLARPRGVAATRRPAGVAARRARSPWSSTAGAIAGPLVVREVVDAATEGTTAVEIAPPRPAVPGDRRGDAGGRRHRGALGTTKLAWRITNELRLDITRHVLGLDHEFHRRHTPGELIQRVDGDVTNVSDFLSQVVPKTSVSIDARHRRADGAVRARLVPRAWGMMIYLGVGGGAARQPAPSAPRPASPPTR